jgi:hypothetical protein
LKETNQSTSTFLVCQDTPFSFKSPSLISISTSNITSEASDCCSHHGSNSMSSLSLATAKHLRNVVPYTIIPFEKQGIQGNAEKFKDTSYASVFVPSIMAHTDQKGINTYGCHGKQQKVLQEYGTTNIRRMQKNGTPSLLPENSTSFNSSSLLHDQSSKSFWSSLVSNDGSNNSNKSSNLNDTNQSTSAFLVCQDTPFSFKSPSLVFITTSNIASKASDCCSHHGSNSMSSLSLATANT